MKLSFSRKILFHADTPLGITASVYMCVFAWPCVCVSECVNVSVCVRERKRAYMCVRPDGTLIPKWALHSRLQYLRDWLLFPWAVFFFFSNLCLTARSPVCRTSCHLWALRILHSAVGWSPQVNPNPAHIPLMIWWDSECKVCVMSLYMTLTLCQYLNQERIIVNK